MVVVQRLLSVTVAPSTEALRRIAVIQAEAVVRPRRRVSKALPTLPARPLARSVSLPIV